MPHLVEIGPVDLERFLKILSIVLLFRFYLPFEKGMALHLNKFGFPLPKEALIQVRLKYPKESGDKDLYKSCQCIFTISPLSCLGKKGLALLISTSLNHIHLHLYKLE